MRKFHFRAKWLSIPAILLVTACAYVGWAQQTVALKFAWEPSPDDFVDGYLLRYGTGSEARSGYYPNYVNAGLQTTASISNLLRGQTFYAAVFAYVSNYDNTLIESLPSNEVTFSGKDRRIKVQPIQVTSDDGAIRANPSRTLFKAETQKIWGQAGIHVDFLDWRQLSTNQFLTISNTTGPGGGDFVTLVTGQGHQQHTDAGVINVYFVQAIADGSFGLALQAANGVAIADAAINGNRRDELAHQIGFTLGLVRTNATKNLMNVNRAIPSSLADIAPDGLKLDVLDNPQIGLATNSTFSVKLDPPAITLQPTNTTAVIGGRATLAVTASGSDTLQFQWRKDGTAIAAATNAVLLLNNVQTANAGDYTVLVINDFGSVASEVAALTVSLPGENEIIPPTISVQPANQYVDLGSNATFRVTATGTEPLSYEWFKDGALIAGQTNAALAIGPVTLGDQGSYHVRVFNGAGEAFSTTNALAVKPRIESIAPTLVQTNEGSAATFTATAIGTGPLSYQWAKAGTNLPGRTSTTLSFGSTTLIDAGYYRVMVSNVAGAVTSAPVQLVIDAAPTIRTQPQDQVVVQGTRPLFQVTVDGRAPIHFRWYFRPSGGGAEQPTGLDSATLDLPNVGNLNEGEYRVEVSNDYGTNASVWAKLTVHVRPQITMPTTAQKRTINAPVLFNAANSNLVRVTDEDQDRLTNTVKVILGKVTLAQTTGLTFSSGDGTEDTLMTFSGAQADVNAALDGMRYLPLQDSGNSDRLTLIATDETGLGATKYVDIHVTNAAPSFVKGADQVVDEDAGAQTVPNWATGISAGPDGEAGQTLTYLVSNNNTGLFSAQPSVATNGTLTYTPAANAHGTAQVTVRLQDNGGTANGGTDTSAPQTFTITVNAVNDAPVVNVPIPNQVFSGTGSKSFAFGSGTFADVDGDALTHTATLASDSPLPGWLLFTPGTRTFSGNPPASAASPLQIKVTATDGKGGSTNATFQLTLTNVNDAPVAFGDILETQTEAVEIDLRAYAEDADHDTLTFSVSQWPAWGQVDTNSFPVLRYTFDPAQYPYANWEVNWLDSLKFKVSDGLSESLEATLVIGKLARKELVVALGSTNVYAGENGRLGIRLAVGTNITALDFVLSLRIISGSSTAPGRSNSMPAVLLALTNLGPNVAPTATITPTNSNSGNGAMEYLVSLQAQPGQVLNAAQNLAELMFEVASNATDSVIVEVNTSSHESTTSRTLTSSSLRRATIGLDRDGLLRLAATPTPGVGQTDPSSANGGGGAPANRAGSAGLIFVVGKEPILWMSPQPAPTLFIYGQTNKLYIIQKATAGDLGNWTDYFQTALTETSRVYNLNPQGFGTLYRVREK